MRILLLSLLLATAAAVDLANPLRQHWPHELVFLPPPPPSAGVVTSILGMGAPRPVQACTVPGPEGPQAMLATIACIVKGDGGIPRSLTCSWSTEPVPGPLHWSTDEAGVLAIDNGVCTLRLHAPRLAAPTPLAEVPHWLDGIRVGEAPWQGPGVFSGDTPVDSVEMDIVASGPVFIDVAIRYRFVDQGADGTVRALRLLAGKQTHRFAPGELPVEELPRREHHYELLLRVVAGDPWIEVIERCRLPDEHHWILPIGRDAQHGLDRVLWLRWFEYDRFGGNNQQQEVAAVERPEQRGRPFAHIGPRWHQRGAGTQDLWFAGSADDAPAYGVVACHASKWVCPAAITCAVAADERGFTFPLPRGDGASDPGDRDDRHFASRSWALVAAAKATIAGTGRCNDLVRRHSDWTLTALVERYVLDWERQESAVGPHILATAAQLAAWRAQLVDGVDGPEATVLRAAAAVDAKEDRTLLELIRGEPVKAPGLPDPGMYLSTRYQDDSVNPTNFGNRGKVNRPFPKADLFTVDRPFGDARTAAIGYIYSDHDAWPGWRHGWHPGNPNFHTDKYQAAAFAGAAMPDHPHASAWLAFAKGELLADLDRTLCGPDAVGYECPGYSAYALGMQLELVRLFANAGAGNLAVEDPRLLATAEWHRHLLTPPDGRFGGRHEAPHGDTHRWHSGMGRHFANLAALIAKADPAAAARLLACRDLSVPGEHHRDLLSALIEEPHGIAAADPTSLDWSSRAFADFGAVLRDGFASGGESFVSLKAGSTHGHYHNDELALHVYLDGRPVALDYNCSYHPRGDHAALHNTGTFGHDGSVTHNDRGDEVIAAEQLHGRGRVLAFEDTPGTAMVLAERRGTGLSMSPVDPHDAEFHRRYPHRETGGLGQRRCTVLVKRDDAADVLVCHDRFLGAEPAQLNLHLLARSAHIASDGTITLPGQLDRDLVVGCWGDVTAPEQRHWGYVDERHPGPGAPYALQQGESLEAWQERLDALCSEHGVAQLPLPGWQQQRLGKGEANAWVRSLHDDGLRGLQVPPRWRGPWTAGEVQHWLRWPVAAGGSVVWAVAVQRPGEPAPVLAALPDGIRIVQGAAIDELRFVTEAGRYRVLHSRDGGEAVAVLEHDLAE